MDPVVLNGAHGEGGSALLRTALVVSALTQQPVRVQGVRGATRKPGLSPEDLTFLRAITAASQADVSGDSVGEAEVSFRPQRAVRGLNQRLETSGGDRGFSPGNALVVVQSLLPALARAGMVSKVQVQGETYNNNALSYDAFERVTLAAYRKQGLYAYPHLLWAGFGFGGKGDVEVEVEPSALEPLDWRTRGKLIGCHARVVLADLTDDIGTRAKSHLEALFRGRNTPVQVEVAQVKAKMPGMHVTVWAEFERGLGCGTFNGQRGVKTERVAENAFESFWEWFASEATVDPYLADQLLVPAVFAPGRTTFTTPFVTKRLLTMAWVIKQFLPIAITIVGQEGFPGTVTIDHGD